MADPNLKLDLGVTDKLKAEDEVRVPAGQARESVLRAKRYPPRANPEPKVCDHDPYDFLNGQE